jgi:putative acetyltransferase
VSRSQRPTGPSDSRPGRRGTVRVRVARTPRDLGRARRLVREYGASLGVDLEFQGWTHELAHLGEEYGPPRGRLLLAMVGPRTVGCVGVRPFSGRICEMKRLFVRPEARGVGAGRALVAGSLRAARALGYRRMRLDTLGSMEAAMTLYRAAGFREIPPYRFNPIAGARYFERTLGPLRRRSPSSRGTPAAG